MEGHRAFPLRRDHAILENRDRKGLILWMRSIISFRRRKQNTDPSRRGCRALLFLRTRCLIARAWPPLESTPTGHPSPFRKPRSTRTSLHGPYRQGLTRWESGYRALPQGEAAPEKRARCDGLSRRLHVNLPRRDAVRINYSPRYGAQTQNVSGNEQRAPEAFVQSIESTRHGGHSINDSVSPPRIPLSRREKTTGRSVIRS